MPDNSERSPAITIRDIYAAARHRGLARAQEPGPVRPEPERQELITIVESTREAIVVASPFQEAPATSAAAEVGS